MYKAYRKDPKEAVAFKGKDKMDELAIKKWIAENAEYVLGGEQILVDG